MSATAPRTRVRKQTTGTKRRAGPAQRLRLKRVYESPSSGDGLRVLVDRLWPRGLTKKKAAVDRWMKEVAPSPGLRKWFGHDPARWSEFKRRYRSELRQHKDLVAELRKLTRQGTVTLLFGARDEQHNDAVVLREVLARGARAN